MTAKKSTAKKNKAAEKTAVGKTPANTPAGKAAATGTDTGSAADSNKSTQPHLQHLCIAFIGDTLTVYRNTGGRAAWQVLRWENLHARVRYLSYMWELDGEPSPQWMIDNVLPLLVSEGDIPMQETALQKQQAIAADSDQPARQLLQKELQEYTRAEQSIQEQMRALEREKRELQQACEELRRQNAALQKPELDQLLSFLPAIFLDFWNVVLPDELANLADRLDVPNVPSPYLQLSQAAVVQKKKEFELLPADRQQKILQFCTTLSGSYTELKLHYEFRDFI